MIDTDKLQEALTNALHGSGFDGTWECARQKNGLTHCVIGFHAMDDNGYYDGWFDCHVTADNRLAVKRQWFTASSYHRRKYISWDTYHGDCVWDAIEAVRDNGNGVQSVSIDGTD